jgi:hypothetical protein
MHLIDKTKLRLNQPCFLGEVLTVLAIDIEAGLRIQFHYRREGKISAGGGMHGMSEKGILCPYRESQRPVRRRPAAEVQQFDHKADRYQALGTLASREVI